MTKSELIEAMANKQPHLTRKDVELAVACILEHMSQTLMAHNRIEIRGFGSFSLHYRAPHIGRDPRSGEPLHLPASYLPYFKPGKELAQRIDRLKTAYPINKENLGH
jgi:integration host factor subunit beta